MSVAEALARTHLGDLLTELSGPPHNSAGMARWHCIAPGHEDSNPSTTVFEDAHGKQRWRCWSCGHSGTAIDALVEARSMSVADAIRTLEERTGATDAAPARQFRPKPAAPAAVALSAAAGDYIDSCARLLWKPAGREARNWLFQRGLDIDVLHDNLVGFDPGPQRLARAEGLPGNMAVAGRPRRPGLPGGTGITFAAFDAAGEPIHVQCRLPRARNFKYANPRRAHGTIPPISFPRTEIRTGALIVTEGIPDGLIALTAGFQAATVTAATTISQATADALRPHAGGRMIVVAFDGDDAGRAAATALRSRLTGDVAVLQLPDKHDLTDTYKGRPTWGPESNCEIISMR